MTSCIMTSQQADEALENSGCVTVFEDLFWKQGRGSSEHLTEQIALASSAVCEPTEQAWRAGVWQILGGLQGTQPL